MSATTWASSGSLSRQFDVFLSYNNRDEASVERIAQRLKRAGLEPWLDKWSLTPGGEWQRELGAGMDASLACAVFVGEHDLGAWELQELAVAIDRAATQQGFRVFPVLLPGVDDPFDPNRLPHFLRARTWVDFRRGRNDSRALQDLINAVKGVPFGPDVPIVPNVGVAPYLGLQVFGEEDAQFFFGRDGEIQRLREKLKSSRFVAVLGPSGSGKSSLVQAGLVPALRAGARAQGERLRVCVLRPGAAPLTVLAAQLARLLPGQAMQATVDALAQDARTLHPEFAQLVGTQQMLVGSMNTDGLRQAIEQPAHRVGLELEQGLSDTILADVGAEPGALPLLEHALLELWERRRGAILTLEGYVRAGGVHGALAQRAEEIYGQLSPDQQQIVRRALLRLTQPGQGTEDTRRRALRDELAPIDGHDDFEVVLSRLVDARLLIAGRDETGKEVVDVSHEALIRGWPRLRGWIDADRAGLLIHRRLTDAAHEWDILNREPASLYRGARLAAAREWATDHDDDLSGLERDFLIASRADEHGAAEAARRRTRRLRELASGLAVLTAIVAALAVWALGQRNEAQRQRNSAEGQTALFVANELEKSLISIDNALGRYVVTGEKRLVETVNRTLAAYPKQHDALAHLISNDRAQQERVDQLGSAIDDYAGLWARPLILTAQEDSLQSAADMMKDSVGRSRLDQIRSDFAGLLQRERVAIRSRDQRAESTYLRVMIGFGIGSLGLAFIVAMGLTMYLRDRRTRGLTVTQDTGAQQDGAHRQEVVRAA